MFAVALSLLAVSASLVSAAVPVPVVPAAAAAAVAAQQQLSASLFPPPAGIKSCLACQKFGHEVEEAVAHAKVGYYDELTVGVCDDLFGQNQLTIVWQFCNDLVKTGHRTLWKLGHENRWNAEDTCIAMGACPAKACPAGYGAFAGKFNRLGQTDLCAVCTSSPVDRFTAQYLQDTNKNDAFPHVHICTINEYRLLAEPLAIQVSSEYFTSNYLPHCSTPTLGCAGDHLDIKIEEHPAHTVFVFNFLGDTFSVATSATDLRTVDQTTSISANVCLCAGYGDNVPTAWGH